MHRSSRLLVLALVFALGVAASPSLSRIVTTRSAAAQNDCQTFPETGKTVCGVFLRYWREHGGLAQQGYPISDVIRETSTDGKEYDTQYFERAVFEHHTENRGTPFEVLLRLLGRERWEARFPAGPPAGEFPLRVGQVATMAAETAGNTIRVEITDIRRMDAIRNTRARGVFIAVFFRATNLGLEPDKLPAFRIKDQRGRQYDESFEGELAGIGEFPEEDRSITDLQPSVPTSLFVVFDVATDATDFTVVPRTR